MSNKAYRGRSGVLAVIMMFGLNTYKVNDEMIDLKNQYKFIKKATDDIVKRQIESDVKLDGIREQIKKQEMLQATRSNIEHNTTKMNIPNIDTSFKSYMDYKAITNKSSNQYKLQQHENTKTDSEGFRRYNDDFIIALGTYYSNNVTDRFRIEFDTGNSITAMVGDIKADIHTDSNNQYRKHNSTYNLVEFIVDSKSLRKDLKKLGTVSSGHDNLLSGQIVKIEKIN